jgi:hypothetical protein
MDDMGDIYVMQQEIELLKEKVTLLNNMVSFLIGYTGAAHYPIMVDAFKKMEELYKDDTNSSKSK